MHHSLHCCFQVSLLLLYPRKEITIRQTVKLLRLKFPTILHEFYTIESDELVKVLYKSWEKEICLQIHIWISRDHKLVQEGMEARLWFELPGGQIVAVKKFHMLGLQDDESWNDLRSFSNEISTLTNLRHRNIVKLYGFCAHNKRHSFLIYEYLQGGSLAQILSDDEKALQLGWLERINVVKAVAKALSYMHHDYLPPVIHRDISINNILFDSEHEVHVSNFGTARFLSPDS
nr:MDIS1-interacting receptor like kinase 2-like [Ipomoea batatas]